MSSSLRAIAPPNDGLSCSSAPRESEADAQATTQSPRRTPHSANLPPSNAAYMFHRNVHMSMVHSRRYQRHLPQDAVHVVPDSVDVFDNRPPNHNPAARCKQPDTLHNKTYPTRLIRPEDHNAYMRKKLPHVRERHTHQEKTPATPF